MSAEHLSFSASKPALQMTQLNYGLIFAMPYLYYAKAGPDGEMLPGNAGRERFSTAVSAADSSARKAIRSRSLRPPPGCARAGPSPHLDGFAAAVRPAAVGRGVRRGAAPRAAPSAPSCRAPPQPAAETSVASSRKGRPAPLRGVIGATAASPVPGLEPRTAKPQPEDLEAVQQVAAESAGRRLGVERAVGGRHDPQVEPLGAVLAEPSDLAVLRHPQISSLPVPDSPSMTTGNGEAATRGIFALRSCIGPLSPSAAAPARPLDIRQQEEVAGQEERGWQQPDTDDLRFRHPSRFPFRPARALNGSARRRGGVLRPPPG